MTERRTVSRAMRQRASAILVCSLGLSLPGAARAQGACAGVAPVDNTALKTVVVASGLTGRPLFVASPPGDANRLFIVEQDGYIFIHKRGDPPDLTTPFLDISAKVQASVSHNEMGLLGLAFDPDYAHTGLFYVNYTEGPLFGPWFTVVAGYAVASGDPDTADPNSEQRILRFAQPQDNHKGGQLQFGADGFLYISTGDGGSGGDPHGVCGNGQSRTVLLGKILRVDVRGVAPSTFAPDCGGMTGVYRIPSTNPFANGPGGDCDEIWAYGLRNPWRSSFDAVTGDLYIADVGQNCWEEIDYLPSPGNGGGNFGWRMMEANHCFNPSQPSNCDPPAAPCVGFPACGDPSLLRPVLEYTHVNGACSITGGYVYRGCLMRGFLGTYFYGDFCAAFIRTLRISGGVVTDPQDVTAQLDPAGTLVNSLTSFGVDDEGEIYITNRAGSVVRFRPPFPDLEVSGPGAGTPFQIAPGSWAWEDLNFDTMHPVSAYKVYRGSPGGSFQCVFTSSTPRWLGGDAAVPSLGSLFAYVVVAVSPDGEQSSPGTPPVSLLPDPCP